MCILIEISRHIKIYFSNVAARNGPKVQSARAPATNRRHAHETSTRTHARVNTHTAHTAHTRRRRTRTLVTTRTRHARTRYVNATHARERTHNGHARTHTIRRCARTIVETRTRHACTRDVHAKQHARGHTHTTVTRECEQARTHSCTLCEKVRGVVIQ